MPNKEIKFRAWDKIEKQMILNPIITDIDNATNYIGLNDLWNKFEENGLIIQQYTGLKDKNGKEIYGGDILQRVAFQKRKTLKYGERTYLTRGIKKVVEWNDYRNHCKRYTGYGLSSPVFNYEVIGNIYEGEQK